jgi:hypothetical protein
VLDSRSENAGIEVVSHVALVVAVELSAQKGGDVLRFHGVDGGANEGFVDGMQVGLPFEDEFGGVFGLHDAPVVGKAELPEDGAIALGVEIEDTVKIFDPDVVGEFLGLGEIADGEEGIVLQNVGDRTPAQFEGKPRVAIEIELELKRAPGGNPKVAEPELFVDEVEVIVEALAGIMFKKCFPRRLVMPGPIAGACLHGGEDMHELGLGTTSFQDFLNAVFLAEGVDLSDELDFDTVVLCDTLGVFTNRFPQRLGKLRIVEYPDLVHKQKLRHPFVEAPAGESALNDDTVKA